LVSNITAFYILLSVVASNDDSLSVAVKALGGVVGVVIVAAAVIIVLCILEYRRKRRRRFSSDKVAGTGHYRKSVEVTNPSFELEMPKTPELHEDSSAAKRPLPAPPEGYTSLSTLKPDVHCYAKPATADAYAALSIGTRDNKHVYIKLETRPQSTEARHDYEFLENYLPSDEESPDYLTLNESNETELKSTDRPPREGTVHEFVDDDQSTAPPRKDSSYVIPSIDYEPHNDSS
jgi:hypothetical protein